nr:F-box/FBD/LRR-repeat protein At1g13570-like [Ipomoea trifida]
MAQCPQLKTLPDLISALPVEVKDRILECLSTRDAARTALLSRHWNDVWLQHGRLVLDRECLESVHQRQDDPPVNRLFWDGRSCVNIINNILFLRTGPVKKFTLKLSCANRMPQQSDFDRSMDAPEVRKIQRMLECIPRESSNAHIVCTSIDKVSMLKLCTDIDKVSMLKEWTLV